LVPSILVDIEQPRRRVHQKENHNSEMKVEMRVVRARTEQKGKSW